MRGANRNRRFKPSPIKVSQDVLLHQSALTRTTANMASRDYGNVLPQKHQNHHILSVTPIGNWQDRKTFTVAQQTRNQEKGHRAEDSTAVFLLMQPRPHLSLVVLEDDILLSRWNLSLTTADGSCSERIVFLLCSQMSSVCFDLSVGS